MIAYLPLMDAVFFTILFLGISSSYTLTKVKNKNKKANRSFKPFKSLLLAWDDLTVPSLKSGMLCTAGNS